MYKLSLKKTPIYIGVLRVKNRFWRSNEIVIIFCLLFGGIPEILETKKLINIVLIVQSWNV